MYKKDSKRRKANVSATYGVPLQCHQLKYHFKFSVNVKNIENYENQNVKKTYLLH